MFEMYAETDELRNFCFSSCPKQNDVYPILFFSAVVVQNTTNSPSIYGKYSGLIRSIVEVNITYETIINKLVTTIIKAIINKILTISYDKQIRKRGQKWLERWTCNSGAPSSSPTWLDLFSVVPSSNPPPCLRIASCFASVQVGILNPVKFNLSYLFQPFARPH